RALAHARPAHARRLARDCGGRDAGRLSARYGLVLAAAEPEQLRVSDVIDGLLGDREAFAEEADALEVIGRRGGERLLVERHGVWLRPPALRLLCRRDEVAGRVL